MSDTSPPLESPAADLALARACCQLRPATAARLLDVAPPDVGAALLAEVDATAAARVLVCMALLPAAATLAALPDAPRGALLLALDPPVAAEFLRATTEEQRERSLSCLARAARAPLDALLEREADVVGAHLDPRALSLARDATVAEALERLRAQVDPRGHTLFVTAPDRTLVGAVGIGRLLSEPPERQLLALLEGPPESLPASAPLAAVWDHPAWLYATELPVTDSGGRFIGTLSRNRLVSATAGGGPPAGDTQQTARALAELYGVGSLAMLRWAGAVLGELPTIERRLP